MNLSEAVTQQSQSARNSKRNAGFQVRGKTTSSKGWWSRLEWTLFHKERPMHARDL